MLAQKKRALGGKQLNKIPNTTALLARSNRYETTNI
jgi:hypothetical protein